MDNEPRRQAKRKRVTTTKRWVERGPLVPWMYAYLRWLAEYPTAVLSTANSFPGKKGRPYWDERIAAASREARQKINRDTITALEKREDAVAYFEKLRTDTQFLAKEHLRGKIAKNLELRDTGLDMAAAAQDHKAIEHYTRPFVELGFPKKIEKDDQAPRITIKIGSSDAKKLLDRVFNEPDDVQDVSYEVIEPKQLDSGDEDD